MSGKNRGIEMRKKDLMKLLLSAMFLAFGLGLPFLTGQIPQIGKALLPMHLPVLLCGFICGAPWGLMIGFITPPLRSLLFGMPIFFPTSISMAFELCAYGFLAGFLYRRSHRHSVIAIYRCLMLAMIGGRLVWGLAQFVLLGISGGTFTLGAFLVGAFTASIPGIVLQLVLIPTIMIALNRMGFENLGRSFQYDGRNAL